MDELKSSFDEAEILKRLDRSPSDALLKTIAGEIALLHRMHARLAAQFAAMESLQAVVDRVAAAETTVAAEQYPRKITVDAADSFQGALGLYNLEYDSDGAPFRWSGPDEQFSFRFFIDRRAPVRFTLVFGKIFAEIPPEHLRCFVDGESSELTFHHRVAAGYEAHGVMPLRRDSGGSVLTFAVPATGSPDIGSQDQRRLGVLFRRLTVEADSRAARAGVAAESPLVSAPSLSAEEHVFFSNRSVAEGGGFSQHAIAESSDVAGKFAGEETA
jgi:hypothetical protein